MTIKCKRASGGGDGGGGRNNNINGECDNKSAYEDWRLVNCFLLHPNTKSVASFHQIQHFVRMAHSLLLCLCFSLYLLFVCERSHPSLKRAFLLDFTISLQHFNCILFFNWNYLANERNWWHFAFRFCLLLLLCRDSGGGTSQRNVSFEHFDTSRTKRMKKNSLFLSLSLCLLSPILSSHFFFVCFARLRIELSLVGGLECNCVVVLFKYELRVRIIKSNLWAKIRQSLTPATDTTRHSVTRKTQIDSHRVLNPDDVAACLPTDAR